MGLSMRRQFWVMEDLLFKGERKAFQRNCFQTGFRDLAVCYQVLAGTHSNSGSLDLPLRHVLILI